MRVRMKNKKRAETELIKGVVLGIGTLIIGIIIIAVCSVGGFKIGEKINNEDLGFVLGVIVGFMIFFGIIIPIEIFLIKKVNKNLQKIKESEQIEQISHPQNENSGARGSEHEEVKNAGVFKTGV